MTSRPIDRAEQESVIDSIIEGRVTWCRARLLHAFARAAEQGVLQEVLDELADDGSRTSDLVMNALRQNGWLERAR